MTTDLREALIARLLESTKAVPTSSLGRLGRTAATALRGGRFMLGRRWRKAAATGEIDLDSMLAIVSNIGELKGIAMKMAQIMSYVDIALPKELQDALSVLQTHAQPMPLETVREILSRELGEAGRDLGERLEPVPIAAASIGQVHRATLASGERVAVKVQYPEMAKAIAADFRPTAIGTTIASVIYPGAKIEGFIAEARARFLEECDYRHEAKAQARFVRLFASHPTIRVPEVRTGLCSEHVLTSRFVDGQGFDAYLSTNPPQAERDRFGEALFEFYVGTLFRERLYNCDPHPGNYLVGGDGHLHVLDYGCTRAFEGDFVRRLAELTAAVHVDEHDGLHRAFVGLGMVQDGKRYDFDTARDLVRAFYGPMLEDRERTIELGEALAVRDVFRRKRELLRLTLPGEFLFLFRIRFGLLSVLARLGARANWYRLERRYAEAVS